MSNRTLSAHAQLVIPMPPLRVQRRRAISAGTGTSHGLGPVQEASLAGIISLSGFWGLAELAFLIFG
ncbi:hypothetical protein GCM10011504_27460 [Siccirubricoccus deserti]|uniref:Uncharacterized protein n=1 Tax=Siccirubricoccus deserti TaxID=2013562 RepID=A0A9X0QYJ6_9PROT|nr:hypothetical protein [Siccirubricoccus deserti]MBC4016381.1 hypothetical protein [Siccirubricoccus deserti]GGC47547.1 hypothetical protein GCM10011504_27460 [Siccirubricoccus deserti]